MTVQITKDAGCSSNQHGDSFENKVFWMRDPKTGFWIPENHFDDLDVADLRRLRRIGK